MKNEKKIQALFDYAYAEQEKLSQFYFGKYHGFDEDRMQKMNSQQELVADAYKKAVDLLFQTFEEEGIHHISQIDEELADEWKQAIFEAEDQVWNARDWDQVIVFDQRILSFDWCEGDDKYGSSWTIEGNAKDQIARAYGQKGDLAKANALYESYIQEDYACGAYWFAYINFLMEDDTDKLPVKLDELNKGIKDQKIKMADTWINDLIYNLRVSDLSMHMHFLQEILDERETAGKKKEAGIQTAVKAEQTISVGQYGKYLPKKKLKELKKKGIIK